MKLSPNYYTVGACWKSLPKQSERNEQSKRLRAKEPDLYRKMRSRNTKPRAEELAIKARVLGYHVSVDKTSDLIL